MLYGGGSGGKHSVDAGTLAEWQRAPEVSRRLGAQLGLSFVSDFEHEGTMKNGI